MFGTAMLGTSLVGNRRLTAYLGMITTVAWGSITQFAPGGDFYNLAWQLGGAVAIRVTPRVRIGFGARWMHVSNGQGLGPQNPSYEAVGFPISVDWAFRLPPRGPAPAARDRAVARVRQARRP